MKKLLVIAVFSCLPLTHLANVAAHIAKAFSTGDSRSAKTKTNNKRTANAPELPLNAGNYFIQ